jgi:hypothetical protein
MLSRCVEVFTNFEIHIMRTTSKKNKGVNSPAAAGLGIVHNSKMGGQESFVRVQWF